MKKVSWEQYTIYGCPNCRSKICDIITEVKDNVRLVECEHCNTKFILSLASLVERPKVLEKVKRYKF